MFSGCEKCYDTPCGCGYEYRHFTVERLQEHITMLQRLLYEKITEGSSSEKYKIPAAGQVWLTKSGNYAYIVQMNVFDVLNRDHRLGFLWYDKLDRELVCTEIMSQLDTPTDLTFTDWLSATGLGNNSQMPKIPANQETNLQIGDWVRINSVEVGMITETDGEYALVSNMDSEYKIRLTDCQLVYRRQDRLPLTWE